MHPSDYFHFYLGVFTNKGRLVEVKTNSCVTEKNTGELVESFYTDDFSVQLYLRKLRELTEAESKLLVAKGMSIGRPRGYSFSPEAFVFLLSCQVDLFGLIENGLATRLPGTE